MSDFRKSIGNRIKESRIAMKPKVTQSDMAERLNVSRQTILDLEFGKTSPKAEILVGVSEFLNKTVNWILTGDNHIVSFEKIINSIPEGEAHEVLTEMKKVIDDRLEKNNVA